MKRWATHLFIASYLGLLGFGLSSHALTFLKSAHVGMYFIVWDMYCGWDAHETRRHLVAERLSGNYYELTPAPWGEFVPYGSAYRRDYDYQGQYSGRIITNVLSHTEHEPITRVYMVDEIWSRKYNLPESLWKQRYDEPYDKYSYNYLRAVYLPSGEQLQLHYDWKQHLASRALLANPRLMEEVSRAQPYLAGPAKESSPIRPVSYLPGASEF
ncbi:MAG: hypothetical protein KDA75_02575 [Planctomycetaceae bacterium]|nr:hypothetical protein [Planctomycetaceae bacterium]